MTCYSSTINWKCITINDQWGKLLDISPKEQWNFVNLFINTQLLRPQWVNGLFSRLMKLSQAELDNIALQHPKSHCHQPHVFINIQWLGIQWVNGLLSRLMKLSQAELDNIALQHPKSHCHQPHVFIQKPSREVSTWWRHQMEIISALLALCVGNSPVTGEFPTQKPMMQSFDVFFDLRLNKRLSKQLRCELLEMPSRS